jgi:hypothetical protein
MMTRSVYAHIHLLLACEFQKMTEKDIIYNDFRDCLKERVGFHADIA